MKNVFQHMPLCTPKEMCFNSLLTYEALCVYRLEDIPVVCNYYFAVSILTCFG